MSSPDQLSGLVQILFFSVGFFQSGLVQIPILNWIFSIWTSPDLTFPIVFFAIWTSPDLKFLTEIGSIWTGPDLKY